MVANHRGDGSSPSSNKGQAGAPAAVKEDPGHVALRQKPPERSNNPTRRTSTRTSQATSPHRPLFRDISSRRAASSASEDPELPRPPRPASPPAPEANAPPPAEGVTTLRLSAHYAGLVSASMMGCLIRLGLEALATYDGSIVFPLLWAQGVGCGIMGLALARKNDIISIYPPLYTFLTTGLAGSVTTFSSWMLEGYLAFSNGDGFNRKGLHDTVDGLAYTFATFLVSLACIHLGAHVSSLLPDPIIARSLAVPLVSRKRKHTSSTPSSSPIPGTDASNPNDLPPSRKPLGSTPLLDTLTIISAFVCYLIALLLYFLAPGEWRHRATFPILLSPPGAMLRFALGRVNTRPTFLDRFPISTFVANMIATLVLSGVYVAQRTPIMGGGVRCNALWAIQQGFCGCLSTVSTFVVEARAIKGGMWKWIYIGGSVVLGHLFILAIVGGTTGKVGNGPVCPG